MKKIKYIIPLVLLLTLVGCTVVSANRVFPKLSFYWSNDAQLQRQYNRQHKAYEAGDTNWPNIK